MSYNTNQGRFVDAVGVNLDAIQGNTLSADGNSLPVELGARRVVSLTLVTTTHSTDDTLDVTIQTSRDGVNDWYTAGTFTQTTAASTERKVFACDRFVRANYNVTGAAVSIAGVTLRGEAV
jgi:hypothetical protein